jgi:transposase
MMGHKKESQKKLFYYSTSLDKRIRKDHPLRKISQMIDFDFVYDEVKDTYGTRGNVSVPPPVILKMLLLLILYNVRSERELMSTIPERLDWMWFLGYDFDDDIPNHSVLSKARKRWGVEAFKSFFERIVHQCVLADLIDGEKIFLDSSLVQANASNNSIVRTDSIKKYVKKGYQELENRLEILESKAGSVNKRHVSTTDPDASVMRKGTGKAKLHYQTHRAVEGKNEIITATSVTPGEVNEAHLLKSLVFEHAANATQFPETVVADSKYGTIDNYLNCFDLNITAHIPAIKQAQKKQKRKAEIFLEEAFKYDPLADVYICPAGQILKRSAKYKKLKAYKYKCSDKVCNKCELKNKCTKSSRGRTIKRHERQNELSKMEKQTQTKEAKRNIKLRQSLMERSFARSMRYGYKRARWRNTWRVQIQEYLTASVQNIMILINKARKDRRSSAQVVHCTGNFLSFLQKKNVQNIVFIEQAFFSSIGSLKHV